MSNARAVKKSKVIDAASEIPNITKLPKLTSIDNSLPKWVNSKFKYPKQTVRVATLFSGIGAIEHSFERLGLNHEIVFAGDIDPFVKKSYFTM